MVFGAFKIHKVMHTQSHHGATGWRLAMHTCLPLFLIGRPLVDSGDRGLHGVPLPGIMPVVVRGGRAPDPAVVLGGGESVGAALRHPHSADGAGGSGRAPGPGVSSALPAQVHLHLCQRITAPVRNTCFSRAA